MSRTKRIALAVGGTVVVAAGVVAVILVLGVKRVPSFPSLADHPDPTLHGTVAYVSARDENQTWCVEVVAASGGASHEVMCSSDYASPTLAWGEDGRLIMTETYPPPARATAVDVVSGATEVVPAASTDPLASPYGRLDMLPTGERAYISAEGGRAKLTVSGPTGERVLLSVAGPDFYALLPPPVWSPDGSWVLAQDSEGRLLLVTTTDPARTSVLAADVGYLCASSTAGSCLATTSSDVLAASAPGP